MRKNFVVIACFIWLGLSSARAQETDRTGKFGVGVIAGNPTGGTVKYWINKTQAIDAGLGYSGGTAFYADYLWHGFKAFPQPKQGELAAQLGLGLRIRDADFGVRALGGADYWLERYPVELFVELGPVFRVTPGASIGFDGGIGVRYYFARFN